MSKWGMGGPHITPLPRRVGCSRQILAHVSKSTCNIARRFKENHIFPCEDRKNETNISYVPWKYMTNLMGSKIKAGTVVEAQSCQQESNLFRSQWATTLISQLLISELRIEDSSLPKHLAVFCKSQFFSFTPTEITS